MVTNATYFGPIAWLRECVRAGEVRISTTEPWHKQTVRNRAVIMTANGTQTLSVPVTVRKGDEAGEGTIRSVLISDHGNWQHLHWQALLSAYGTSPFYDFYADALRHLYENQWRTLLDYDVECTRTLLRLMDIDIPVTLTDAAVTMPSERQQPDSRRYYQTFHRRHGFVAGLSAIDLLFNLGPEAVLMLQ